MDCPSKVTNLDDSLSYKCIYIFHQDILGFEISVEYHVQMQIPDSLYQLTNQVGSVFLRNSSFLLQKIEQLSISAEFLQNVQVVVIKEKAIHLDDVRVLDVRMNFQLTYNLISHFLVFNMLFRNDF